ncbi:MAG: ORF6N domain-containing protein [Bacteroidales bacterium]|nr:ORF6N domain-containing protein [Bacteroidales bacterium]
MSKTSNKTVKSPDIENRIFTIRGIQVIFDLHLAELYGVKVKQINRAVKRNNARFPESFKFQLTETEWDNLRYQVDTSNKYDSLWFQKGTLKNEVLLRSQIVTLENDEFLRSQNATINNCS